MQIHIFAHLLFVGLCFGLVSWADYSYFQFFQDSPVAKWITRGIATLIIGGILNKGAVALNKGAVA